MAPSARGEYFRRFWLPVCLSEEIPAPDSTPVRVEVMGESLIVFKASDSRIALVELYCPHRQADLFLGRNEEHGLRCVYHGWKFDVEGNCVDLPTELAANKLKGEVKLKASPCQEHVGIVLAYLRPKDLPVGFPTLEFDTLPKMEVRDTDFGFMLAATRPGADEGGIAASPNGCCRPTP